MREGSESRLLVRDHRERRRPLYRSGRRKVLLSTDTTVVPLKPLTPLHLLLSLLTSHHRLIDPLAPNQTLSTVPRAVCSRPEKPFMSKKKYREDSAPPGPSLSMLSENLHAYYVRLLVIQNLTKCFLYSIISFPKHRRVREAGFERQKRHRVDTSPGHPCSSMAANF